MISVKPVDILLPRKADLSKWAVVACDQFTSQKDYWQSLDSYVGSAESTLRLIYPEVYLGENDGDARIYTLQWRSILKTAFSRSIKIHLCL